MVAATAAAAAASGQTSACYKCPEPLCDQVICTAIDLPVPLNLCHIILLLQMSLFTDKTLVPASAVCFLLPWKQ